MSNPYYTVTGAPTTQSRGYSATIRSEYGLIATGFDAVYTAMLLRGLKAGETWTGTHVFTGATVTFATQSALDNSTKAATTAYADGAVATLAATAVATLAATKADIASPTFTGTPAAPTAAAGTSTTQIATTAFVAATAFSSALPAQTGNSGKFVTTNGTTASWAYPNVASVTTATTATTLTSTATLLQITPASYGVAVTLPDATTCAEGGPLHIIDNKGAYPVRVLNSAGTLLGFVYGGVVSHVSLVDNSSAAGTWTIENNELVGASAQLLTSNIQTIESCVSLDSDREFLLGKGGSNYSYGVVYNKTTNAFGTVTAIRSTATTELHAAVKSATDQILVVSCTSGSTAFLAVVLSISGTTITVNTAATATLSANIGTFADGCGLIAVGSSFVCSYSVAGPVRQIRALSISGTTVTIGSAEVLDGTAGGLIAASSDKVIAVSTATTHLYTKPYTVSGSSLSAGTGTDTTGSANASIRSFAPLGTRWFVCVNNGATGVYGDVVSLSGTTTTVSRATMFASGSSVDEIVVDGSKVLFLGNGSTNNANILTDTAGTASAGSAITLDDNTARACLYVNGTDAVVMSGNTSRRVVNVSCSGSSPVLGVVYRVNEEQMTPNQATSNSVLSRTSEFLFGQGYVVSAKPTYNKTSGFLSISVRNGMPALKLSGIQSNGAYDVSSYSRGKSDSERWVTDGVTVITKLECVA